MRQTRQFIISAGLNLKRPGPHNNITRCLSSSVVGKYYHPFSLHSYSNFHFLTPKNHPHTPKASSSTSISTTPTLAMVQDLHRQPVLTIDSLKDGEMKEVIWQEPGDNESSTNKILISRIAGQFYATTPKCTHYGAPLCKGVLASSGRVTCPWHGASFDVKTGDIEDAPGVGGLQSFKVEVEGNQVYVTASKALISKNSKKPREQEIKPATTTEKGVVVIGGGSSGSHAIEGLRESGYKGSITLISKAPYAPIDRTKISKALIGDPKKIELRTIEFLQRELDVQLILGTAAESIDFDEKVVHLQSGEKVGYSSVIIGTGSSPRKLPIQGVDLDNVFTIRETEDAAKLNAAIEKISASHKPKVAIIGSSFIGSELNIALGDKAEKSIIGLEEVPFAPIFGTRVGKALQKIHESKGAKFFLKRNISHLDASSKSPGSVGAVVMKDGEKIEADIVVLAVGVSLNTQLLRNSKGADDIEILGNGSVTVDQYLAVKGVKDAYATGDIVTYPDPQSGKPSRIEHWNVAGNQGRCAAWNIAVPTDKKKFDKIPIFWSAQGSQLRYCAKWAGPQFDDVYIDGEPENMSFAAYYLKHDEVIAVCTMGRDPIVVHSAELFRLGKFPSASEIREGKSPLQVILA